MKPNAVCWSCHQPFVFEKAPPVGNVDGRAARTADRVRCPHDRCAVVNFVTYAKARFAEAKADGVLR